MSSPLTDLAPTFSVRDGALGDLQFHLMAQDLQWARVRPPGRHARPGRTVVEIRIGDTWAGRREEALHALCLIHHQFGVDMVGLRVRPRVPSLHLVPMLIAAGLVHRNS